MHRLFSFVVAVAAMLFAVRALGNPNATERLVVSADGRFLQYADGRPFFWLADTGWLLPERLDRDEAAYYLDRLQAAGYNVVQVQVINGVPAYNVYGQMSMPDGFNFEAADPPGVYSYWDHLDYIVDQAGRRGIFVGMVCVWGSIVKAGLIDESRATEYGRFLANRYKDCKNIVWIMGGDIQGDIHPEVWDALAAAIREADTTHLMTFHPRGRHTSAQWFNDRWWLDFNMFQSGHRRYGQRMGNADYPIPDGTEEDNWMYVDSTWKRKPIKPVLDGEPSYEDIPQGLHDGDEPRWQASDVRRYAYWSVFAGSCGHTYGHNSIMQFVRPGVAGAYFADGEQKPWYKALDDLGFNQMKYLKHLMLAMPYFDRVPDQSVVMDNGTRYERLVATRGRDYLMVYNYTGRDMMVDLSKASGEAKRVWWMDAATGALTYVGEYESEVRTFRYRGEGDGVLIAIDSTKDYLKIGQASIVEATVEERKDRTE